MKIFKSFFFFNKLFQSGMGYLNLKYQRLVPRKNMWHILNPRWKFTRWQWQTKFQTRTSYSGKLVSSSWARTQRQKKKFINCYRKNFVQLCSRRGKRETSTQTCTLKLVVEVKIKFHRVKFVEHVLMWECSFSIAHANSCCAVFWLFFRVSSFAAIKKTTTAAT